MNNDKKKYGRIGVLMGGCSSEREVSLKSGQAIYNSLRSQGFDVQAIDLRETERARVMQILSDKGIDMVFIALHGKFGEDGQIQSICEELGLPYTGSDSTCSKKAFNKIITQSTLLAHNIGVPDFVTLNQKGHADLGSVISAIEHYPLVVKPACEGSSIGVQVVRSRAALIEAVKNAWQFGEYVLIEQYVSGREMTVGILADEPLEVIEIRTDRNFFDFTAKYQAGQTTYQIPAELPLEIKHELQETALKVHAVMGCRDLSRVDFRLDADLKPYVLEINTIPGFTALSLLPKAAAYGGIPFDKLCQSLLRLAYGKKKETKLIAADH